MLLARLALAAAGVALAIACKTSKRVPASGGPAGLSKVPSISSCVPQHPGRELVLGSQTERPRVEEGEEGEPALDLPFSVELGEARAGERTFAVTALENRKGANFAVLAVVDADSGEGHVLELGRVYGDVEPPVLAPADASFLLAVPEGDAAVLRLRLMLLGAGYAPADLRRGPEIGGVRRDDPGYSLAVSEKSGLLAFNTLEKGQGRIGLVRIDPLGPTVRGAASFLPGTSEVTGPRLVGRPSGFYLAYLAREPPDEAPGDPAQNPGTEEGPSALEIVPLDRDGAPAGKPLRISPPGSNVLAFDLAPLAEGSALVTYRVAREPGIDQDGAQAALVRPDGTLDRRPWDVGESSGVPSLLVDSAGTLPARRGFVVLAEEGGTKLAVIGTDPLALGALGVEPGLLRAEPLAVRGNRLLSGTVYGTERRLAIVDCSRAKAFQ